MERRTYTNFLTVTELADTLVRSCNISFRTAHEVVSRAVKETSQTKGNFIAAVERAFPECTGQPLNLTAAS